MTPAARVQAAIEILEALRETDQPLDRFLRGWFRTRRYAGSKDRKAIGEHVFAVQRHRASFSWRMGSESPRALVIASLAAEGASPETFCTGDIYGPPVLTDDERAHIASPPGDAPLWVRGEFPAFLQEQLERKFGSSLLEEMAAFQTRAPVDLRVNTLKATRNDVLAALMDESLAARPARWSPVGVRIPPGEGAGLAKGTLFASGAFEFQDESAQIASLLCGAEPGMRVLDLAAGAGGKSLALASAMDNRGEIAACDVRASALEQLKLRALRAGAAIVRPHLLSEDPPRGFFDRVLVDAPCSGSGTWRRQPELKWRLTADRLLALTGLQNRLLDEGAAYVGPGGRLIYATCSVLPCENEDRVADFLGRNAGFATFEAAPIWRTIAANSPPGLERFFQATPYRTGTDGFFCAVLGRT